MDFADFLQLIDGAFIYEGGKNMAMFIAAVITPILLVVALWIRLAQSQLESVTSGSGKWGIFIKDIAVWGTILGLYFVLAGYLSDAFNLLYDYFQKQGSLAAIQEKFLAMIDEIDSRSDDNRGFFDRTFDVMGSAVSFTMWLFYYFTFLLATFLVEFLKMAHALAWSFALVWGLIAIPMSLVSGFKLLRGWAIFSGVVLCWPLFHFGGFALFNPIFEAAANTFVNENDLASIDQAQLYLIMTFVNLLSVAIALAAPFVAQAFISNSGSVTGVVTPFAMAATAMAGAGMVAAKGRFKGAGHAASDSARSAKEIFAGTPKTPQPLNLNTGSKFSAQKSPPSWATMRPATHNNNTVSSSSAKNTSLNSTVETPQPPAAEPAESRATPQQNNPPDNIAQSAQAASSTQQKVAKVATINMMDGGGGGVTSQGQDAIDTTNENHDRPVSAKAKQAKRGAILDHMHKNKAIKLKGRKS